MNSALLICSKCNTAEQSEKFATIWDLEMHFARQHFGGRALYECRMNGCEIWFYTQTHLWRHFQRNHSGSEQAKSTKLKLKAQEILNKSVINRVSSTIPESGNEMFNYQCFECNKTKSEMFPTFETLEAHIVKKHCDSAVYYECDDNTCGGILQSYGTFLRHYVNEHGKLEENITLKLQIYNSVKESIEKLIFDRSKDHGNPGRGKIAPNRNHPKVVENIETNSYSPDSFEEDTPVRSVLRRLSDVLSNDDSGYTVLIIIKLMKFL
ncbi:zinc finger protein 2 like protein [Ditylenchus destructor]|nr:zinc finger protein 2 like protein [Ditylenchus destructor]